MVMDMEDANIEQPESRWDIDLDWFQQNNRSFFLLAQDSLCPKCRKELKVDEKETSAAKLISTIKKCCSKAPEFVNRQLPILESVFRFLLANGNQPVELEELGKQLSERRGGDTYRTSSEILSRLLKNDRYYGFREVQLN